MHDLLIALAFIAFVICPCLVTRPSHLKSTSDSGDKAAEGR